MTLVLLSANGTLRIILLLLVVWQVLRLFQRMQQPPGPPPPPKGTHWAPPDARSPGDVRIERTEERKGYDTGGHVQDADFEEIP